MQVNDQRLWVVRYGEVESAMTACAMAPVARNGLWRRKGAGAETPGNRVALVQRVLAIVAPLESNVFDPRRILMNGTVRHALLFGSPAAAGVYLYRVDYIENTGCPWRCDPEGITGCLYRSELILAWRTVCPLPA